MLGFSPASNAGPPQIVITYFYVKLFIIHKACVFMYADYIRISSFFVISVKEKLRPDPDSEIALTSLKVSLCCPVSIAF